MTGGDEFVDYILELLEPMGMLKAKIMFGGFGLYREDLMFGIISEHTLYLKTDDFNVKTFTDLNLEQFSYQRDGKTVKLSYYQPPIDALEDAETLLEWAWNSYKAAWREHHKQE